MSSTAPTRVKMRSVRPMAAAAGRHEAPQLGQEDGQGHLAQDGGFAATCWGR